MSEPKTPKKANDAKTGTKKSGSTTPTTTSAQPADGKQKKNLGGRPERFYIDEMRTIAWCLDLERRTGKTANGLRTALLDMHTGSSADKYLEFRFDRFENGQNVPTSKKLDQIDSLDKAKESRKVFEIGPEEQGRNVPLWELFGDQYDHFWNAIDEVIPQSPPDCRAAHCWRIDYLAELLMEEAQWQAILSNANFQHQDDNPVVQSWNEHCFKMEWQLLATAIALWRLSMLVREGVAPTEYLLHCLLAGPLKPALEGLGIHAHVCELIRFLSIQDRLSKGQITKLDQIFEGLPVLS